MSDFNDLNQNNRFNTFNLQNLNVLINTFPLLTISHLEWTSDIIESNSMRDGKLISSAFQIQPVRGVISLEQSEKIALAEFLKSKNRLLSGIVCDLIASDIKNSQQFNFSLKRLRFSKDSFRFSSSLDDIVSVHFILLGSVEWNLHI